jgi:hypothetical protein
LLENNPNIIVKETKDDENNTVDYSKMTTKELKTLAKERGFNTYNNLKKDELVKLHDEFDNDLVEFIIEEEDDNENIKDNNTMVEQTFEITEYKLKLENGCDFIIPIRQDGFINATELCKAGGKNWYEYIRSKRSKSILEALESNTEKFRNEIIITKIGGDHSGTWIHRLLAIDLASWIYPPFAVQILKWTDELMSTGKVKLERPVKQLLLLNEIDIDTSF